MNTRSSGPLTDKDYQLINQRLGELEQVHMDIQRARAAGFDCGPEDVQCQQAKAMLAKIKQAYFPERS